MVMGLANEICMIDINNKKAFGEALDIQQGTPFCTPCRVYSGDYSDAEGSNIVIITSGAARKPGMSRLDLAQINVDILNSITPEITKYANSGPDLSKCKTSLGVPLLIGSTEISQPLLNFILLPQITSHFSFVANVSPVSLRLFLREDFLCCCFQFGVL